MTTSIPELGIPDEVFEVLGRLRIRYELLDGQLVVSPSAKY